MSTLQAHMPALPLALPLAFCALALTSSAFRFEDSSAEDIQVTYEGNQTGSETGRNGGCVYTQLQDAQCSVVNENEVEVKFCNRRERLHRTNQRATAFQDVLRWNPEFQKKSLDRTGKPHTDSWYIQGYTGTFHYARNVGRLFKGIAPHLKREDREGAWAEESNRGKLTKEVLKFGVGMGTALNKLQAAPAAIELYRGGWEPESVVQNLLAQPSGMKLPWFQSTTSFKPHSLKFMHDKYAPKDCQGLYGGCMEHQEQNVLHKFPVHYTYKTSRAKDVTDWNPDEHEHILLPNLPFDVTSAKKVVNDPLYTMELSEWLKTKHRMPEWVKTQWNIEEAGPWPIAAAKVSEKRISGQRFAQMYRGRGIYGVCDLMGLDFSSDAVKNLYKALQARFVLPPEGLAPHNSPWYIEVVLKDAVM